jgi:hypothetical protein
MWPRPTCVIVSHPRHDSSVRPVPRGPGKRYVEAELTNKGVIQQAPRARSDEVEEGYVTPLPTCDAGESPVSALLRVLQLCDPQCR